LEIRLRESERARERVREREREGKRERDRARGEFISGKKSDIDTHIGEKRHTTAEGTHAHTHTHVSEIPHNCRSQARLRKQVRRGQPPALGNSLCCT